MPIGPLTHRPPTPQVPKACLSSLPHPPQDCMPPKAETWKHTATVGRRAGDHSQSHRASCSLG